MTNKTEVVTQKTKTMKEESRETELDTRHRKTNKTEVTTQKDKTMRDTDNIRHKTQNKDKQNRSYNTES